MLKNGPAGRLENRANLALVNLLDKKKEYYDYTNYADTNDGCLAIAAMQLFAK